MPIGLGALQHLETLTLSRCPVLTSLDGIEELLTLQSVSLVATPALDLDRAFASLAELPELALGPIIGVGEVKLLWFSVALRSEELNEDDVWWDPG